MSNINGSRLRHGHRRKNKTTPEYSVWMKMRARCNSESCPAYKYYGGRGIKVCKRWDSFELFYEDIGPRPDGMSLDRIDNDKGYEPGNCRWTTMLVQQRNRRSNRVLTAYGITASLAELCERFGAKYKTAHLRLKMGATIEAALSPDRAPYKSLPLRKRDITLGRIA